MMQKLRSIIEDDRSTIEGGVEAFNKLIHQDGVSAISWSYHLKYN